MQTLSRYLTHQAAPLYVRWSPENGRFTIELKLAVVRRILDEMRRDSSGTEVGGILIGSLPSEAGPVLRISDVQMLKPAVNVGKVFLLDPREHDRFVAARWQANEKGRTMVGFFRTHQRSGPMRPSLADRTLLAGEFQSDAHVLLLISAREPHTAAFFTGSKGELAQEPSVKEFPFDEGSLKALPEIEAADATSARSAHSEEETEKQQQRGYGVYAAGGFLAIALAAAVYAWSGGPNAALVSPPPSPGLHVSGNGLLRITWNPLSAPARHAAQARLLIIDGDERREVRIDRNELKDGAVEYQAAGPTVQVELILDMPGGYSVAQAISWSR